MQIIARLSAQLVDHCGVGTLCGYQHSLLVMPHLRSCEKMKQRTKLQWQFKKHAQTNNNT